MVPLLMLPRVKVSLPRLTAWENDSSVRTPPPAWISAIAMRMLDVPMSMTATWRAARGAVDGRGTVSGAVMLLSCTLLRLALFGPRGGAPDDRFVTQPSGGDFERLRYRRSGSIASGFFHI